MKILVIEDSVRLGKSLSEGLSRSGFSVDLVDDGAEGVSYALANDYDVIVLDLMLPGMHGLDVLNEIRSQGRNTNILILSAQDQATDRVRGLDRGADDYLVKPFVFEELIARVNALVRRGFNQRNPLIRVGNVCVNTALHEVRVNNRLLLLTPTEQSIVEILIFNQGRVISPTGFENQLKNSDNYVSKNSIEVHISSLRRKLKDAGVLELIKTRRGFGYYIDHKSTGAS